MDDNPIRRLAVTHTWVVPPQVKAIFFLIIVAMALGIWRWLL